MLKPHKYVPETQRMHRHLESTPIVIVIETVVFLCIGKISRILLKMTLSSRTLSGVLKSVENRRNVIVVGNLLLAQ